MDNVLVDFQSGLDRIDEETKNEYRAKRPGEKDRLDEIPCLFGKMDPMPGAIEAVHKLAEVYDVYILSTAPWKNPSAWSDKVMWVTKYFDDVFHKRMIITHRKDLVEGDYLIDDRGKNGTSEFKGEWIQFGSEKFPDWNTVVNYLLNQCEYRWEDGGYIYVFRLDRQSASFEEIDRLDFSRYLLDIDVQGLMWALHITDLGRLAEEVKAHFNYRIMEHFLKEHGIRYSTYSEAYFD